MKHLHIDVETYSDIELGGKNGAGVYPYVEHPSFEILLFAYQYDRDPVVCIDITAGERVPEKVLRDMQDPNVLKIAHNAPFEIVTCSTFFGIELDPMQWRCTLVMSAFLGLPLALGKIAEVLKLSQQKDTRGDALIRLFCNPYTTNRKKNPPRRILPEERPEEWEEFKEYNIQDVRTESDVYDYVCKFPIPDVEWVLWGLDFEINDRGVLLDEEFARAAIRAGEEIKENAHAEIKRLTGVDNPNSGAQLKTWLEGVLGYQVHSLNKKYIEDALDTPDDWLPKKVRRVFELRLFSNKTSVAKYEAMIRRIAADGRLRAFLQFYGANRTGRWAGRGVQPHNLPRNVDKHLNSQSKLEVARDTVIGGIVDLVFDNSLTILSQLLRTALVAPEGRRFAVSDFSAIEARVIAWLAGEQWRLDVFNTHGKIYEASASQMFGVPLEQITKDSPYRAKGKVAELALGYQGANGALIAMGALRDGLEEKELKPLVRAWRAKSPAIVKLWYDLEAAVKHVLRTRRKYTLKRKYTSLTINVERGILFVELPSGRRLAYYGAHLGTKRDPRGQEREAIMFYGINQTSNQWVKMDTYGGSLVENAVQAIARDLLADAMLRMRDEGLEIVLHVHDEAVVECDEDRAEETLDVMNLIMSKVPQWAENLPTKGDGFVTTFYKKD